MENRFQGWRNGLVVKSAHAVLRSWFGSQHTNNKPGILKIPVTPALASVYSQACAHMHTHTCTYTYTDTNTQINRTNLLKRDEYHSFFSFSKVLRICIISYFHVFFLGCEYWNNSVFVVQLWEAGSCPQSRESSTALVCHHRVSDRDGHPIHALQRFL